MNYTITRLLHVWLGTNPRYDDYDDAMGVLSCVQFELYRTRIAQYEEAAIDANGPLPAVG